MAGLGQLIDIDRLKEFGQGLVVPLVEAVSVLTRGFAGLADAVENLDVARTASEQGANGLRYYNGEFQAARITYDAVTAGPGDDPKAEGWYVLSEGEYVPTADTAAVHDTAYFKKTVTWTAVGAGGGMTVVQIPQAGPASFCYDGTEKTLPVTGFDAEHVTASGTTATDAGTYTAVFSLKDLTRQIWSDGTAADKTFTWTVGKAAGSVSLDRYTVSIDEGARSSAVTASVTGDGVLSAVSGDPELVSASVEGNSITVSSANGVSGETQVTVRTAETDNYSASSAIISVSCDLVEIYGAEWDGSASPAWSRTDMAADFEDPVPAVKNGAGSSPFDSRMPWSGMERVEDPEAGTLVRIPKFYYKWTRDGVGMNLRIANKALEGFHISPAHADRGDGKGERDFVYVGAYHCAAGTYKSESGASPACGTMLSGMRGQISSLGETVWQWDFAMYWTICMLYLVEYAHWDSQTKIGLGCGNNSGAEAAGLCDGMDCHTGTAAARRTVYGHTRYRYIEDLWGNVFDWVDGVYIDYSSVLYAVRNPSDFTASPSAAGTRICTRSSGYMSGRIETWTESSVDGFEYVIIPDKTGSLSYDSYVCDQASQNSSSNGSLTVGGSYSRELRSGLFCMTFRTGNETEQYIGSRLMKLP